MGVTQATISTCVREVAAFFYQRQQRYIIFPNTADQQNEIAADFAEKYGGIPSCIGAIDGTHIPILRPHHRERDFINRKRFLSLNVMVMSNANNVLTHVDPRFPGSIHDAYIFRASDVNRKGMNGNYGDNYLLGDSGYPLKNFLLTPLRNPRNAAEQNYNRWHKHTRASVEATIGIMKQRFRCIDNSGGYLYHHPTVAAQIVVACACLHNIAMNNGMPPPIEEHEEDEDGRRRFPPNNQRLPVPRPQHIGRARIEDVNRRQLFIEQHFAD